MVTVMPDLNIENKNGFLGVEYRTDGGIGVYVEIVAKTTHLALSKQETMLLIKWLVGYINNLDIVSKSDYSTELDKVIEEEMKNKPKDIMK